MFRILTLYGVKLSATRSFSKRPLRVERDSLPFLGASDKLDILVYVCGFEEHQSCSPPLR